MAAAPAVAAEPDARTIKSIETVIWTFLAASHPEPRNQRESRNQRDQRDQVRRPVAQRNLWRQMSSLTLLQLVAFVEQKFSIKVRPIDFAPQNFSTVAGIARFVAARRRRAADP